MASPAPSSTSRGPLQRLVRSIAPDPTSRGPEPSPTIRLKARARAFIAQYLKQGCSDPCGAAKTVGYAKWWLGEHLADKYAEPIARERIRRAESFQMELDEGMRITAGLARAASDEKVKLGALRTILQVHGALSEKPLPPAERRSIAAQIEELVASIAEKAARGGKSTRALVESTDKDGSRVRVGVEVTRALALPAADGLEPPPDPDLDPTA